MAKYYSDDITWCMNRNCKVMKCERNPKHIRYPRNHSFAILEGTEYCMKEEKKGDGEA